MSADATILIASAATIAFVHTVLGPDHYLVFTAMGRARRWSLAQTIRVTFYCGVGHVLSSVVIGGVGLVIGAQLANLVEVESVRGNLAGWALLSFGLVYFAWGLKRAARSRSHTHVHSHGDLVHEHEHDHHGEHAHVHDEVDSGSITPWALFIVFILGPCEALIPLLMYPAAEQSAALVFTVAAVFGIVTLLTMLALVAITSIGLAKFRIPSIERYSHAIAGAFVVLCGSAISFLGL